MSLELRPGGYRDVASWHRQLTTCQMRLCSGRSVWPKLTQKSPLSASCSLAMRSFWMPRVWKSELRKIWRPDMNYPTRLSGHSRLRVFYGVLPPDRLPSRHEHYTTRTVTRCPIASRYRCRDAASSRWHDQRVLCAARRAGGFPGVVSVGGGGGERLVRSAGSGHHDVERCL